MKTKNYLLILLLLIGFNSCDHFEELNTDPTTSTTANPKSLISTVQTRYSGDRETQWRSLAAYHMAFTQMISDGWTVSRGQVYEADTSYMEYMWRSSYNNINDLQLAINEAEKHPAQVNYLAVARILKVMIFAQLTDTYGDIPYFTAVSAYNNDVLHPTYDNQELIYNDFFIELKEASMQLDNSKSLDGDLIFQGNINKWKKFANSLRLRYALRLVNANESKAKLEALAAISDGVMQSSDDTAFVTHGNHNVSTGGTVEIRGNGFSQVQQFSEEIIVGCETYISYLRDNNDPRLLMLFGMYGAIQDEATSNVKFKSATETSIEITEEYQASYGNLVGFPNAKFLWDPTDDENITWAPHFVEKNGNTIQINKYFKALQIRRELTRIDLPTIYQSYSETELWLSEVAQRGWSNTGGDAKTHFTNAITANVNELVSVLGAYPNLQINTGVYAENIWNVTSNKLEAINMQHYVNNFYNGIEGFANWRRSGFPSLVPAQHNKTDPALNGLIPRRLPYPNSEMNFNRANLESHLDNGVNFWGAPVWWDNSLDRGVNN